MVTMQSNVQPEVLGQTLIVTKAQHIRVVPYVTLATYFANNWVDFTNEIQALVNGGNRILGVIYVAVDARSQGGQLGDQVQTILEHVRPVFALLDAAFVGSLEHAIVVQSSDTHAQLGHGMEGFRQPMSGGVTIRWGLITKISHTNQLTSPRTVAVHPSPRVLRRVGGSHLERAPDR
jgi:hypothetical protein